MYVVYAQGVYRHTINGVFSTLELAKKAALNEALEEYDGYHYFVVAEAKLDKYVDDIEPLFSIRSKDHVWERDNRLTPLTRKICMYNNDKKVIEVLLDMTKDMEL